MSETSNKFNHDYHIQTVIDTEAPVTSGGTPPSPEAPRNPNKKKGLLIGGISGLAALAIAVPTFLALESNGDNAKSPAKGTETSTTVNPTESPSTSPETKNSIENLQIPLNATPDQIGSAITEITNAQYSGNLDQETMDTLVGDNTGKTFQEMSDQIATKNVTAVFNAQYIPNWQNDSNLSSIFAHTVSGNSGRIFNYTSGQTLRDSFDLKSAALVSSSPDQTVVTVTIIEHYTNSDPKDSSNVARYNNSESTETFTLVPQSNRLVISQQKIEQQ